MRQETGSNTSIMLELPSRRKQPKPPVGGRTVQTMIPHFSSQGRPGLTQRGGSAGREQLDTDLFQGQSSQQDGQAGVLRQDEAGQVREGMDVVETNERNGIPDVGAEANPTPENVPHELEVDVQPHDVRHELLHHQQEEEQDGWSLLDRIRPQVPPAKAAGQATSGWESVRRLGGWQVPHAGRGA